MTILINGSSHDAQEGERLIDAIGRAGVKLPHVCYHPQLGPIQICDTCIVEVDGKLVRGSDAPPIRAIVAADDRFDYWDDCSPNQSTFPVN